MSQSLHLLNGDTTTQKVQAGDLIGQRLAERKTPPQVVEELYLRCLSRKPTEKEAAKLNALIFAEADKKRALDDAFWALLNSREFMFNH